MIWKGHVEMKTENLENEYINVQMQLEKRIDTKNLVKLEEINLLAGVDLAYWKKDEIEYAVCCIVVIDYNTQNVVEKKYCIDKVSVPYIPGCLAFREIPLFLQTKQLLKENPDIYIFDGNGYLHPRHMGVATHAGIILDKPSIGIAKTYYKVDNTDYSMPQNEKFSFEDIVIHNKVYGRAIRTQKNVKPIFLSIGNKIDLNTAMEIIKNMITKESHIPMPTRLADIMTHEVRKQYM